jgi:putative ABC transport system permease protein
MSFLDILQLSLRNLREAKLRAALTTMGVIVGVAVIVTMVSFGLGLQRNTIARFKELDLFNEITVFGRSLYGLAASASNKRGEGAGNSNQTANRRSSGDNGPPELFKASERTLDDAALAEIAKIPGVAYVEPNISFVAYVRANEHAAMQTIAGALVPNPATRFKEFAAGRMIGSPDADEAVVDESFVKEFGYAKAADVIGQQLDLLAPRGQKKEDDKKAEGDEDGPVTFFGLPVEDEAQADASQAKGLVARSFRIVGVLKSNESDGRRMRGLTLAGNIYIPLAAARAWVAEHRDDLSQIALQLARETGALGQEETIGYGSAIIRVTDPVVMTDVRKRLSELGFESFSIMDQLEQLRTIFLIINSTLGLLGGISLLVASFGIANTMIMSILERTREIGIMKAIGAEDREIKLIFFVEAAVIGLTGGVVGVLAAWGIDGAANRLAYRFILKPQGASYVDFFALPPYLWLGAILFAVAVSIIAALYPASRAARIDPVKALRHD